MSKPQSYQNLKDLLEVRRSALNEEIASYPGPITGCDAQFNHLLEQRVGLNAELVQLAGISKDAETDTLRKFIETCPFLVSASGEKQK